MMPFQLQRLYSTKLVKKMIIKWWVGKVLVMIYSDLLYQDLPTDIEENVSG
jgi:hypothetical protein